MLSTKTKKVKTTDKPVVKVKVKPKDTGTKTKKAKEKPLTKKQKNLREAFDTLSKIKKATRTKLSPTAKKAGLAAAAAAGGALGIIEVGISHKRRPRVNKAKPKAVAKPSVPKPEEIIWRKEGFEFKPKPKLKAKPVVKAKTKPKAKPVAKPKRKHKGKHSVYDKQSSQWIRYN